MIWCHHLSVLSLLFLLGFVLFKVNSQCCLRFEGENCVSCPPNTHLFRGNCLNNRPNCQSYVGGFDCFTCDPGFRVDPLTNSCVQQDQQQVRFPSEGFLPLPQPEYDSMLIETILATIQQNFNTETNLAILKVYLRPKAENSTASMPDALDPRYYRILFSSDLGFLEVVLAYTPQTNTTAQELALLNFRKFEKVPEEQFINLLDQPNRQRIALEVDSILPNSSRNLLADGFRSLGSVLIGNSSRLLLRYRLYVDDPALGVRQANVSLEVQPGVVEQISIGALNKQIGQLLARIVGSNTLQTSFAGTTLMRVTRSTSSGIDTYNATYRKNQTNQQLFIIFDIDINLSRVLVRQVFIPSRPSTQNPTNNTTQTGQNTTNTSNSTTSSPGLQIPETGVPSLKQYSSSLVFKQEINILNFIKSSTFDSMRQFLQKFYTNRFVGSDLIRVSTADNSTTAIHELVFRVFTTNQLNQFYTFAVDKSRRTLELIRQYSVPMEARASLALDDSNRTDYLSKLSPALDALLSRYVRNSAFYNQHSELVDISKRNFTQNSTATSLITFRFYNPPELNLPHEYISYRIITRPVQRYLSTVVYPLQNYKLVENSDQALVESIDFYVQFTLLEGREGYTRGRIWESADRIGVYRVQLEEKGDLTLWEIDTNGFLAPRMISKGKAGAGGKNGSETGLNTNNSQNLTVNSTNSSEIVASNATNSTNQPEVQSATTPNTTTTGIASNSTKPVHPPKEPIPTTQPNTTAPSTQPNTTTPQTQPLIPTPQLDPVTQLVHAFPNKTTPPTPMPTSNDPTLLTQSQLCTIISTFIRRARQLVTNIRVQRRECLANTIQTYTVQFEIKASNIRTVTQAAKQKTRTFVFQVEARSVEVEAKSSNLRAGLPTAQAQNLPMQSIQSLYGTAFRDRLNLQIDSNFLSLDPTTSLPEILPLQLLQSTPALNLSSLSLSPAQQLTLPTLSALSRSPLVDPQQLGSLVRERAVGVGSRLVSLEHGRYGGVDVVASVGDGRVTETEITEVHYRGYAHSSARGALVDGLGDLQAMMVKAMGSDINQRLRVGAGSAGSVSNSNVAYWKLEKIGNVYKMQAVFNLQQFLVVAEAVQRNKTGQPSLTTVTAIWALDHSPKTRQKHRLIRARIDSVLKNSTTTSITKQDAQFKEVMPEGCNKATITKLDIRCMECNPEYLWDSRASRCYQKVSNCRAQVGELCFECDTGYIAGDYGCR